MTQFLFIADAQASVSTIVSGFDTTHIGYDLRGILAQISFGNVANEIN